MKDFKFDSEGKLIFDDSLKEVTDLERIEIAKLERQYKTVIPDVNPTDEFVRTLPGIASRVITESVDLANLLTETTSLEKKAGKFLFGKEGAKKIEELNQEIKNRRSKKLTNFYNTVFGERNIEQEERGEGYTLPIVKAPQGIGKGLTRDIGGFAALLAGPAKKIQLVKEGKERLFKKVPLISRNVANVAIQGGVAEQFAFNPYDDLVIDMIGEAMFDDDTMFPGIKEYMLQDKQDKGQLRNRIALFGEGMALGGLVTGAFKSIKYGGDKTGATEGIKKGAKSISSGVKKTSDYVGGTAVGNFGKASLKSIKETGEGFVEHLDKIKKEGKEAVQNFIDKLDNAQSLDRDQKVLALKHRGKDIEAGKITDGVEGDIDALKPGFIASKLGFKTNLIFTENSFIRRIESFRRKAFTTKGNRTRAIYEKYLKSENSKESWTDSIGNIAYNMEVAIDKVAEVTKRFKNKEELQAKISDVLFTDFRSPTIITPKVGISLGRSQKSTFEKELNKLPLALREPLRAARGIQDKLSVAMIDSGTLTLKQQELYKDQMGFYVRRSFKLFDDPNYIPSNAVQKEAEVYLRTQLKEANPNLIDEELNAQVNSQLNIILERSGTTNDIGSNLSKFDKINKNVLKGKKEIPDVLLRLMGEVKDPMQSIIHSTTKLANYVENVKFYDEAFDEGAGIYFRETGEGVFNKEIPEGFGKLSGRKTTPELFKYFSNYKKLSQQLLADEGMAGSTYRNVLLLKGLSQAAKTVWSHTTHVKNIAGGAQMSLANGINVFDLKQTKEIIKTLRAKTSNDVELQKFHEELSSLGLLNKGVVARDLKGLANDIGQVKKGVVVGNISKAFNIKSIPYYSIKKGKFTTASPSRLAEKAQDAYIAEDDFFKINMYLREKDYLTKMNDALPDSSKYKMKTEQEIKERAALMTRDHLPNYDLVPELLQDLRRTPVFGRFFSFMAESVRIGSNSVINGIKESKLGFQMIKNGDRIAGKQVRDRGIKRLSSFMVMAGGAAKAAEVGSQAAYGFTTDKVDALKALVLPDYMQNSNIIISEAEDGSPVVANLSSWDAYDFPKKPLQVIINKYMNEDSLDEEGLTGEILSAILTETVSPFLGESIIQEQLSNYFIRGGRTIDGKKIKNSFNKLDVYDDSFGTIGNMTNNLPILMSNLLESVTPGSITRAADLYSTLTEEADQTSFNQDKYEAQAFLKFVTGWGMSPVNPEYVDTMYKYKAGKFNKKKSELRNELRNAIDRKDFNLDVFTEQYLDVNTRYYKEYAKFAKLGEAFNTLGGDQYTALKDTSISSKDRFAFTSESYFVPLGITDSMEVDILNATSGFGEYIKVKQDINAIQNKFASLPVFHNQDNYKSQKEKVKTVKKDLRENYKTGGLVPNVEENPEDRINPVTGQTYEETRLGFSNGGVSKLISMEGEGSFNEEMPTIAKYENKSQELEALISNHRLVSKEAQMSSLSGEGYKDPRFIKTTGVKAIDKFGLMPFAPEGSGQVLSTKELGIKGQDSIPDLKAGTYNNRTDVLKYKDVSKYVDKTTKSTQVHELFHRAARKSGWLDNFYKNETLAPNISGSRGRQLTEIINEAVAESYEHTSEGGKLNDDVLEKEVRNRVSKYNVTYPDKITKDIMKSLPELRKSFEKYTEEVKINK